MLYQLGPTYVKLRPGESIHIVMDELNCLLMLLVSELNWQIIDEALDVLCIHPCLLRSVPRRCSDLSGG